MNLIFLFLLFMKLLMMRAVSSQSSAHKLFLDPSDDPFLDSYIETITHMSTNAIMAIPKMNDEAFLQYLNRSNNDATRGVVVRVDTSVFDPLRDDQLKHQNAIDKEWETLMISGPIVVGYMGNLMVLASKKDFPFHAPPEYIYRYIRYPDSFRATLSQVSTDMYNALMGAHTAMDQIQLAIKQVPTHVKTAMKLISSASDNMLKSMLPGTLGSVARLATESATVANSTLLRFTSLQDLLAEIIELSTNTQSVHEAAIEEMKEQQVNSTLEQERLQENLEAIQTQYNDAKANLELARQKYAEAMKELSESATPIIISDGGTIPDLLTIGIGLIFSPLETVGCILSKCGPPNYRVDNTKFENAMKIAQAAKEDLERAEKAHNDYFLLQLGEQNELARTINEMAMLDLSVLNTEEVVGLLLEAVDQIVSIREQWSRMIQFFSKLAVQAQSTQQVVVKDFVDVIQQAQTDNLLVNLFEREFFVELLIPTATTIESDAHLLYTMATTYYSISSEYMINQIAGIGKMLIIQTDAERNAQLQQTRNDTLSISLKISALAQERHTQYLEEMHNRQTEYTTYMDELLATEFEAHIG